jgi:hypothetical protein
MDKNTEDIIKRLKNACQFRDDKDYEIFSECIEELKSIQTIEVLHAFFESLNDKDAGEIQYELIEACEEFSDKIYVEEFIKYSYYLRKNAGEWYIMMLQTILNTVSTKKIFLSLYNNLADKQLKISLYDDVKEITKDDDDYKSVLKKMNNI